jgi:hypothetical protein
MRLEGVPEETFVTPSLCSTEFYVRAKLPLSRTAPDYNERAHELHQRIVKALPEGWVRATIHLMPLT